MNPLKTAATEHPIHDLIAARWSPYAFSDVAVSEAELQSLFEAARWAPSSYNEQPWRYIIATKTDSHDFERILSCLVEGNQVWAKNAPVLALGCTSLRFARNGELNAAAMHDLGLASATLTFEATARGLYVHQMIGILPDKARSIYAIPDEFVPLTGLAIGHAGRSDLLPAQLQQRDATPRERKSLHEVVFAGQWGQAHSAIQ